MIQLVAIVCLIGIANTVAAELLVESLAWSGYLNYSCPCLEALARPRGIAVTSDRLFVTLEPDHKIGVSLAYILFNDTSPIRLHPYPSREGSTANASSSDVQIIAAAHIRVDSCLRLWVLDKLAADRSVLHIFNLTDHQLLVLNHSLPVGAVYSDMFVESGVCNRSHVYLTLDAKLTVLSFDGVSILPKDQQLTAGGGLRVLGSNATDWFFQLNHTVYMQRMEVFNLTGAQEVIGSADWAEGAVAMGRGVLFSTGTDNSLKCWSPRMGNDSDVLQQGINRTLAMTVDEDGVLWLLTERADGFSVLSRNLWDLTYNTSCQIWVSKPETAEKSGVLVSTVLFIGLLVLLNCTCLGGVGTMVWKVMFNNK